MKKNRYQSTLGNYSTIFIESFVLLFEYRLDVKQMSQCITRLIGLYKQGIPRYIALLFRINIKLAETIVRVICLHFELMSS